MRMISQKPLQLLGSPNLTEKYSTRSPEKSLILRSKGQRSSARGAKTVPVVFALLWVRASLSCVKILRPIRQRLVISGKQQWPGFRYTPRTLERPRHLLCLPFIPHSRPGSLLTELDWLLVCASVCVTCRVEEGYVGSEQFVGFFYSTPPLDVAYRLASPEWCRYWHQSVASHAY